MNDTVKSPKIDVEANRRAYKWSRAELLGRGFWEICRVPFFAWTPRPFWAWRRLLLRLFGAKIGHKVHIHPSVRIAIPWNLVIGDGTAVGDSAIIYNLGRISLGEGVTVSQFAHLCAGTHDYRSPDLPLLKPAITVEDGVWICADAFVGPGVNVGAFAIVGARSVVLRDVEAWAIVGGNPARRLRARPEFIESR